MLNYTLEKDTYHVSLFALQVVKKEVTMLLLSKQTIVGISWTIHWITRLQSLDVRMRQDGMQH